MGANMYNPKVGDTIRVTFEDVVTGIDIDGGVELANAHYADEPFVFDLDEPTLVGVELVKPPVEYFKPGDRIRRLPTDYTKPYEITLGDGGYIHHGASDSWLNLATGQSFTSERFELVTR